MLADMTSRFCIALPNVDSVKIWLLAKATSVKLILTSSIYGNCAAMTRTKQVPSHKAPQPGNKRLPAMRAATDHHGSLREAMLRAAESILTRDGIRGLTLRAAAREAGVSHAAPKNHFADVMGLLCDLGAVGFA